MHPSVRLMESQYNNNHSEVIPDNAEESDEFHRVLRFLATRERNAIKALEITSVEDFCLYDFKKLHSLRGYGETTVEHLQSLQKQIRLEVHPSVCYESNYITLQTPVGNLHLSTKERNALHLLGVATTGEFLDLNLERVLTLRGGGTGTYLLLEQSKKRYLRMLSATPPDSSSKKVDQSVFSLPLNPREKNALVKLGICSLLDFANLNLYQIKSIPNFGLGTIQSLHSKQTDVREQIVCEITNSQLEFSWDSEFSAFLLDLSVTAKEALWHLAVTTIGELANANLSLLECANTPNNNAFGELYQVQGELLQDLRDRKSLLNDYLASTSLEQLGTSETALALLRQNNICSLQAFFFFSVPEDCFVLQQLQFELRCQFTPIDFFDRIPSYCNVVYRLHKNKTRNSDSSHFFNSYDTVKCFLAVSFEDIAKWADGDLKTIRDFQTAQYEIAKLCLSFHESFALPFVNDEREQGWTNEIHETSLLTVPFFSGKASRNFSSNSFHWGGRGYLDKKGG